MAQIHQIQLQFLAEPDRGLLRVNTHAREEFRFWITRRYAKILWPVLQQLMQTNPQVQSQASSESREAVVSFQHESAISKGDFDTPFQPETTSMPLGEEPVVLARVQLKNNDESPPTLCLHPLQGTGIEIAMNEGLVHSLSKLVLDLSVTAEWCLDLQIANAPATVVAATPQRIN